MSTAFAFPWAKTAAVATALVLSLMAPPARAEENLLHGPHPFLRENAVSIHVLLGQGLGETPNGTKLSFGYGWKIVTPLWLDMQLNLQRGNCQQAAGATPCAFDTGSAFETVAGVAWKWATALPIVPFARAGGGLVFVYPNGANAATGLVLRAAGGATYFFFDWLGIGAQVGYSIGRVNFDATFPGSHTYSLFDFGGGIETQF